MECSDDEDDVDPGVERLYTAAWNDDVETLEKALDEGVPINALSSHGLPALYGAIENTSMRAFERLLQRGASPKSYGSNFGDYTPLAHAVLNAVLCHTDNVPNGVEPGLVMAVALIGAGADPTAYSQNLRATPLKYADDVLPESILAHGAGAQIRKLYRAFSSSTI